MATSKKRTPKNGKTKKKSKQEFKPQAAVAEVENPAEPPKELQRDLLDDFLFHAANYIYIHRKLFITLAVLLAVIIVSVYGAFRYLEYRNNLRNEDLFAIEQIIHDSHFTAVQRSQKAMPMLNRMLKEHPDTKQAELALLYRGELHYSNKQYKESEADFAAVRASQENGSELYILASIYLSNVLRDQSKLKEAVEVLQSAQSGKLADVLLMEQAEIYSQSDQKDKAREKLNILLKDYPKSVYADKAKQMLKLL